MGIVFDDIDLDVVKLSIGGTAYYLSTEYFIAGSVYSGSPDIYPLLVNRPSFTRSFGLNFMIYTDVTIEINGHSDFTEYDFSFSDALAGNDLHGTTLEIRYYLKAKDAVTTHSDNVNIRHVAEIIALSETEDGTIRITARQQYVKNVRLNTKFTLNDTTLANMDTRMIGEYIPNIYGRADTGRGVNTLAPYLDFDSSVGTNGNASEIRIFTGAADSQFPVNGVTHYYVKNQSRKYDSSEYIQFAASAYGSSVLTGDAFTGSVSPGLLSLSDNWYALIYKPTTLGRIVTHANIGTANTAVGHLDTGVLSIKCYEAIYQPNEDSWQPINQLAVAVVDTSNLYGGILGEVTAVFNNPIVLSPNLPSNVSYMFAVEWSNADDATYYPLLNTQNLGGTNYYKLDITERESKWIKVADKQIALELHAMTLGSAGFVGSSGNYSYQTFSTYDPPDGSFSAGLNSAILYSDLRALNFRLSVQGRKDNLSGTYTGTPSSLIYKAPDIMQHVMHEVAELPSALIDTTGFSAARTKIKSHALSTGILADGQITVEDLLVKIAKESRLIPYMLRNGKRSVAYPIPTPANQDVIIDGHQLRFDCKILNYGETPYTDVVNDFEISYNPDPLNQVSDLAFLRTVSEVRSAGIEYCNDVNEGTSTKTRKTRLAASVALYGRREMKANFSSLHVATSANQIMEYYIDKFYRVNKFATIRIPRRKYYNSLDIFNSLRLNHISLPAESGSRPSVIEYNDGAEIKAYNDGVPLLSWTGGSIRGIVTTVTERDSFIDLTVETTNPFMAL
jgi:hypothetical protein